MRRALGAEVTVIERDIIGGAAHLWDCIPSKAMIATGAAIGATRRANQMGLESMTATLDFDALRTRIAKIESDLESSTVNLLHDQAVRVIKGTGRLTGPHSVVADTADGPYRDRCRCRFGLHRQ